MNEKMLSNMLIVQNNKLRAELDSANSLAGLLHRALIEKNNELEDMHERARVAETALHQLMNEAQALPDSYKQLFCVDTVNKPVRCIV